jgi:DNA adenine methylase
MRAEGQYYYEPFIGGAWVFMEMEPPKMGSDLNKYVIALYKYVQGSKELVLPETLSSDEYYDILHNKDSYPDWAVGYTTGVAFGGVFSGGYSIPKGKEDPNMYVARHNKNLAKHRKDARQGNVFFRHCRYNEMDYRPNSLIYCDPPYASTAGYKGAGEGFDSAAFWEWAEDMTLQGHTVVVSEFTAPDNWECIYSRDIGRGLRSNKDTHYNDRLFMLNY